MVERVVDMGVLSMMDSCRRCERDLSKSTSLRLASRTLLPGCWPVDLRQHSYCYLRLFRKEYWEDLAIRLGPDPSIYVLLGQEPSLYDWLRVVPMRATRVMGDVYHFGAGDLRVIDIIYSHSRIGSVLSAACVGVAASRICEPTNFGMLFDAQIFTVTTGRRALLWFDQPILWIAVNGVELDCSQLMSSLEVKSGDLIALLAIGKVKPSFQDIGDCSYDGLCYMTAVQPRQRLLAFEQLGRGPSYAAVSLCSLVNMEAFARETDGGLHVGALGKPLSEFKGDSAIVVGTTVPLHETRVSLVRRQAIAALTQPLDTVPVACVLNNSDGLQIPDCLDETDAVPSWVSATKSYEGFALNLPDGLSSVGSEERRSYRLMVWTRGLSLLVVPKGARFAYCHVVYGSDTRDVYVVFKRGLYGHIYSVDAKAASYVVLTDEAVLDACFDKCGLRPGYLETRFLRATADSFVLGSRKCAEVESSYEVDDLTDELDERAIGECRLQAYSYDDFVYHSDGYTTWGDFRTYVTAQFQFEDWVCFDNPYARVAISGDVAFSVSEKPTLLGNSFVLRWSLRIKDLRNPLLIDKGPYLLEPEGWLGKMYAGDASASRGTVLACHWVTAVKDYVDTLTGENLDRAIEGMDDHWREVDLSIDVRDSVWIDRVSDGTCVVVANELERQVVIEMAVASGKFLRVQTCDVVIRDDLNVITSMVCLVDGDMLGKFLLCASLRKVTYLKLVKEPAVSLERGSLVPSVNSYGGFHRDWAVLVSPFCHNL